MTVAGLAMTALLPAVRSTPGLSRTPRRIEAPTPLAFVAGDSKDWDLDQADPASFLARAQEGDADDSESSAEESLWADWMAIRTSRARSVDRARAIRDDSTAEFLPSPSSGRPSWRPAFATASPHVGLSVRLCRLLF